MAQTKQTRRKVKQLNRDRKRRIGRTATLVLYTDTEDGAVAVSGLSPLTKDWSSERTESGALRDEFMDFEVGATVVTEDQVMQTTSVQVEGLAVKTRYKVLRIYPPEDATNSWQIRCKATGEVVA